MPPNFSKLDLQKLTTDAAKYPNAGVPPEKMDFWRNLESSLLELHHIPTCDSCEGWVSLIHGLQAKKFTAEHQTSPVMPNFIMDACRKDRQPIPEVPPGATLLLEIMLFIITDHYKGNQEEARYIQGATT